MRVLERGAEQGRAEHDPHDREAGWQQCPPRAGAHRAAVEGEVQHLAPADPERVAEPDEGERRLLEDREADDEDGVGEHERHDLRDDVPPQDVEVRGANGAGAGDERTLPHGERLGAHDARRRRPAEGTDDEDDVRQAALPEDGDDDDEQRQVGDDEEEVGEAHEQCADPAPRIARHEADGAADDEADESRGEADDDADLGAVQERAQDVLAAVVGAEQMRG